jgi:hypothetical protein
MSYKRTSSKEEREQVNRLKIDLYPIRELVSEKEENRLIG